MQMIVAEFTQSPNGAPDLHDGAGFSAADDQFLREHGISALGIANPGAEQSAAQDPFGLNRAAQIDPFAGIRQEAPSRLGITSVSGERPQSTADLKLGNWREIVARQEEEAFIKSARAAGNVAVRESAIMQNLIFEDMLHRLQDEPAGAAESTRTGKRRSRRRITADSTR